MKPDNVTGSPLNPQNWNLYSYVRGNPVNMNDPTGHFGDLGQFMRDLRKAGGPEVKTEDNSTPQGDEGKDTPTGNEDTSTQPKQDQTPPETCTETIEKVNPITGQQGVNVGEQGEFGTIRCSENNPQVGQFGFTRDGGKKPHYGIDINAPEGTTVVAAAGGKVTDVGVRGVAGNRIQITLPDGTITTYAHLKFVDVSKGQVVKVGEPIGISGTTGNAQGLPKNEEHLHFSVISATGERLDPEKWLNDSSQ